MTPDALQSFFASDVGRAALAQDGQTDSVTILEADVREDRLILHTIDKSAVPSASRDVWRALFDLGGRFVSVSLYGLPDQGIPAGEGLETVDAQVDRIMAANAPKG